MLLQSKALKCKESAIIDNILDKYISLTWAMHK